MVKLCEEGKTKQTISPYFRWRTQTVVSHSLKGNNMIFDASCWLSVYAQILWICSHTHPVCGKQLLSTLQFPERLCLHHEYTSLAADMISGVQALRTSVIIQIRSLHQIIKWTKYTWQMALSDTFGIPTKKKSLFLYLTFHYSKVSQGGL